MNEEVEVVLQKDAYFADWSVWSPCSTCSDKNFEKFGIKTRSASCIEGEKIQNTPRMVKKCTQSA